METLLFVVVLAAGIVWEGPLLTNPVDQRLASFALAHVLVSLTMTLWITPLREVLLSWIWRFRGQRAWTADALWGNRTENTLAVVGFAVPRVLLPAHDGRSRDRQLRHVARVQHGDRRLGRDRRQHLGAEGVEVIVLAAPEVDAVGHLEGARRIRLRRGDLVAERVGDLAQRRPERRVADAQAVRCQ